MSALEEFEASIREAMREAVPVAVCAGADGYQTDEQFWLQVRRVLGGGFYDARGVVTECELRMTNVRRFPNAIALRTLKEAALRRV